MTWNLEDSVVISFKLKDNYFLLSKNDYNTSLKNCLNSNVETNSDFDSTYFPLKIVVHIVNSVL